MANLSLRNISKIYPGGVTAVNDLNLEIRDQDFVVLVGPSGCGKTTTLRMIAGLEDISQGEMLMDGKLMNAVPPKERDMAMVFQNYALYPHMSVYENIAFGLKLRKVPKPEIKVRVEEVARMLEIAHLLPRKPKALSGGQRQRVAMGRAIVRNPNIFLLDEPLSNLDAALRDQIRAELIGLYQRLAATFIYVTHDQTEALTLGTKIVVMKDGLVQQVAAPDVVFNQPANTFVAGFIGSPRMNLLETTVEEKQGSVGVSLGGIYLPLAPDIGLKLTSLGLVGQSVTLGIRPEHIVCLAEMKAEGIPAKREMTEMLGADSLLHLNYRGSKIVAHVETAVCHSLGEDCLLHFPAEKIRLFRSDNDLLIV